jgi:GNAT superfamily N-acetyltransferase
VVDSRRRREGLGKALVARAEQWARERSLPKLRVRSNVTREESHRFYPAIGFVKSKTQHVYEKKG